MARLTECTRETDDIWKAEERKNENLMLTIRASEFWRCLQQFDDFHACVREKTTKQCMPRELPYDKCGSIQG